MNISEIRSNPASMSYYNELKDELGKELIEKFNPLLDELTIKQLRCLANYIQECCHQMSSELESTVTIEDFEKVMKEDVDADNEEGESTNENNENNEEGY